jgi:hypothetical protein
MYALYNEVDHSKQVKQRMEALQAQYDSAVAQMDRNTYEYQRLSFEFAIKGYEEMAKAYDEKAGNYKIIMGVGGVAAGVAGAELAMAQSFPMPCNPGFAGANLAAGGVMLAMAGSLNGMASSAAKDHRAKAGEMQNLLNEFDKYHTEGGVNHRPPPAPPSVAGITTQIDNDPLMNGQTLKKIDVGQGPGEVAALEEGSRSCINGSGRPDFECGCASNNSCAKVGLDFNLSGTSANVSAQKARIKDINNKTGAARLVNGFNQFAAGRKDYSKFRKDALEMSEGQAKAGLKAIADFNSQAEELGMEPINFGAKSIRKLAGKYMDPNAPLPNLSDYDKKVGPRRGADIENKKVAESLENRNAPAFKKTLDFKKGKILGDLDFVFSDGDIPAVAAARGLASDEVPEELEVAANGLKESPNYGGLNAEDMDQVNQNRNYDLFKIISLRYRRKFFVKRGLE